MKQKYIKKASNDCMKALESEKEYIELEKSQSQIENPDNRK